MIKKRKRPLTIKRSEYAESKEQDDEIPAKIVAKEEELVAKIEPSPVVQKEVESIAPKEVETEKKAPTIGLVFKNKPKNFRKPFSSSDE